MKLSCNGCRILRKGCSENCIIRPCLEWINSPESQSNATLFLAKFYGRTALLNLINAAPQHLAPGVFKSLLYEACGRLVNPTYGLLGLFWSGEWEICESAVNAVLSGSKINGVGPSSNWHTSSCDMRGRNEFKKVEKVIKPKPNWQSERMEAMDPSFLSLNDFNPDSGTHLDLELTLGCYRSFPCQ